MEQKSGKIVLTGSIIAANGNVGLVDYAASKGGVIAMSKSLAKEVGPYGINVNCVSPGLVPRPNQMDEKTLSWMKTTNYLGRVTMPEDVANVVLFLASPEADMITGANYVIDGGRGIGVKER